MKTFLFLLSWFILLFGSVLANITTTQFVRDPQNLISPNSFFKLGFFSTDSSSNRYVGIWYDNRNVSGELEVIWIANRDSPLNDTSGVLRISENGNLQLLNAQNTTFWSTNITSNSIERSSNNSAVAQLLDTGNLVLRSNASGNIIWQSFDHPTSMLLPRMALIFDGNTRASSRLTSWQSPLDPSSGRFTIGIRPGRLSELYIWDDDRPYWRTGPWNGNTFIGVPAMFYFALVDGFRVSEDSNGRLSLSFGSVNHSVTEHYELTYEGVVVQKEWDEDNGNWTAIWQSLESDCDIYGNCGEFGRCNSNQSPICSCLRGFEPRNSQEWNAGNWSGGCVRRTPTQCGTTIEGEEDVFLRLRNVKVPDNAEWLRAEDEEDCRSQCLGNCSCLAYSYYLGVGCMVWNRSLIDIQEFVSVGVDLFIRLAHSELQETGNRLKIILPTTLVSGAAILALIVFFLWRRTRRKNESNNISKNTPLHSIKLESEFSDVKFQDLLLFKFEELAAATNNFDDSNKLGQGGFGPVFKGILEDGKAIAVKRLSRTSGQGLQEFMNEVDVISKLQHRNLVKLLGCFVDGEEKMLVYEYMPNKSLDVFLFDSQDQIFLDWKKRLNIIEGICRGLLYLHRDSRLRIIHRDLKASNILLDEDLNPKISDFGMARIFGGKEEQGSTRRVVGTFGYMSPEYAMEGRFSEKSDVFSLGVLLLEIVSGKKNTSLSDDESMSIIGYAWKLRNEDNILSLIDPTIRDSCFLGGILRCIEVGLLCVQEFPEERPSISTIISMLDSEITDLPQPMQPVFTQSKELCLKSFPINSDLEIYSVNNMSFTSQISGR